MSFDQDPNEQANVSAADFAMMCDEMKALKAENERLARAWEAKQKSEAAAKEEAKTWFDAHQKLKAELETERMRLAACGVAALSNTPDTAAQRIGRDSPYWSASYGDVCAAVDREMELRAFDVRKILIDVQPGMDGMGHEVYARSIEDVEKLLSDLSTKLDDLQNKTPPKLVGYVSKTSYETLARWHIGRTPKNGEMLYTLQPENT